ncbi:MAG TPA: hypothetical protein EYQ75_17775 [Planctomycetaceae bacterium]|nr:hypothetical protein [Planctomycetaceae bacterium]
MPTTSTMALILALSGGVPVLFYIAALIFVVRQQIDRGSAKPYLIFGLSLLLIHGVSGIFVPVAINRFTTPVNITVLAVYSLLSALVFVMAIVF